MLTSDEQIENFKRDLQKLVDRYSAELTVNECQEGGCPYLHLYIPPRWEGDTPVREEVECDLGPHFVGKASTGVPWPATKPAKKYVAGFPASVRFPNQENPQ